MLQSLGNLLVHFGFVGAGVQFVVMLALTLVTTYGILRMRHDDVVVLSHGQLLKSAILSTVICTLIYQAFLWFGPAGRWSRNWVLGAAFVVIMLARMVTMGVLGGTDGGKSVRDTSATEAGFFNCNWPLISRCANQSLFMLIIVYLYVKQVWVTK
jgi:hypothetical protein